VEVEAAIDALALFDTPTLPQLSHGICPACLGQLEAVIDAAATGAPITLGSI
jgi:hypothetical protein